MGDVERRRILDGCVLVSEVANGGLRLERYIRGVSGRTLGRNWERWGGVRSGMFGYS